MRSLAALLLLCCALGCGGYTSTVTAKESPGWIRLVGDMTNVTVSVDKGPTWSPKKEVDRYELAPGTHEVRIFRGGQLVVQRAIIVTEGIEAEVKVP